MSGRVIVTGANGFVGSAVLARLARNSVDVFGMVRKTSDLRRIEELSNTHEVNLSALLRIASLDDAASLEAAFADCDIVIHTAAMASDYGSNRRFRDANADGIRRLIDAMPSESDGVERRGTRLILISTANVSGYGRRDVGEEFPDPPPRFAYSRSKLEGELIAMQMCKDRDISLQVLRPGGIYGPGDWKWSSAMFDRIRSGGWPLIDGGRAVFTPVYIENLCDAIILAVDRPERPGTFNITDNARVSWREFSEWIAESLGCELDTNDFPFWLAYPVAAIAEGLFRLIGSKKAPGATRYRVVRAARDFDYSCAKAIDELGYQPDPDIQNHIRRTVEWYRSHSK